MTRHAGWGERRDAGGLLQMLGRELGRLQAGSMLRSAGERKPPLVPLPEHDGCVSALLYGRTGHFDALPFPNMEWWWNAIEVEGSDGRWYFMVTNVHSFGNPLGPPITCGTVALFDVRSGRRCVSRSVGSVTADRSCAYVAPGWLLQRLDPEAPSFRADLERAAGALHVPASELARASTNGCYVVSVSSPEMEVHLYLEQHASALYGDPATPGWYDNNPHGLLPHWASYRSRFETPRGTLQQGRRSAGALLTVTGGNARFDHQSVHWSTRDNGLPSPPALVEQLLTRPKWIWYHGRVGDRLNVMAYKIWNANLRTRTKVAGAIADEASGALVTLDPSDVSFNITRTTGALAAPVDAVLTLHVREGVPAIPAGAYELQFRYDTSIDWTVDYAVGRSLAYRAQEAFCTVSGRTPSGPASGTGTQEVLDLGGLRLA